MHYHSDERPEFNTPEYRSLRNRVFAQDKWSCVLCGAKGNLEMHHIKKWSTHPEKRYLSSNCVSLCQGCHTTVTGNEEKFEEYFQEIVAKRIDDYRELSDKKGNKGGRPRKPWKPRDWRLRF